MGSLSIWHWLIVLAVVLLVFGRGGRISDMMGDFGKGIKSFKKGLNEDESHARLPDPVPPVAPSPVSSVPPATVAATEPGPSAYDPRSR